MVFFFFFSCFTDLTSALPAEYQEQNRENNSRSWVVGGKGVGTGTGGGIRRCEREEGERLEKIGRNGWVRKGREGVGRVRVRNGRDKMGECVES
jgi:hypothetical protein